MHVSSHVLVPGMIKAIMHCNLHVMESCVFDVKYLERTAKPSQNLIQKQNIMPCYNHVIVPVNLV